MMLKLMKPVLLSKGTCYFRPKACVEFHCSDCNVYCGHPPWVSPRPVVSSCGVAHAFSVFGFETIVRYCSLFFHCRGRSVLVS